jgi:hypothetical protein
MQVGAGIFRVLLLFPTGQTFNNKSFNKGIRASDDFSLERKRCIFLEATKGNKEAIRVAVGFDVAMDKEDGNDVSTERSTAAPTDATTDLFNLLSINNNNITMGP